MSTPTVSMQIFGEGLRKDTKKRIRSQATKKAWKTRRRLEKLSPTMQLILEYLASSSSARIRSMYARSTVLGYFYYGTKLEGAGSISPFCARRNSISIVTVAALEKRQWIKITAPYAGDKEGCNDVFYTITDKGRKALERSREHAGQSSKEAQQ